MFPKPHFRTIDDVWVRYVDSGGDHDTTILLTSPWPESVFAFERVWPLLADHARLFAVDLPGFGASDPREALWSPRAMGGWLADLVTEAGLGTPLVVAPDVGTPAALFAAADHPEAFAGLVVGTGGTAVPLDLGEPLRSWVLDPDFEKYQQMDPALVIETAVGTVAGGVSDAAHADYLACYRGDRFSESMRFARRYPDELPVLAELLGQIATPVTIACGRDDRVVPLSNAEFVAARVPGSPLEVLDAGHFCWEERPGEYAAVVVGALARARGTRSRS